MFSKADKNKASNNVVRAAPSLISTDLEITGNLQTSGEVQLDGNVTGDVNCAKLVIGEKAVVTGHIDADEVMIRGQVTGRIKAKDVHLSKTARVIGDIWHDSLAIDAGAFLDGHCKRNDAKLDAVTASASANLTAATGRKASAQQPAQQNVAAARPEPVPQSTAKTAAGS